MLQTVKDIFDIAIWIIDSQNESNGNTRTADTKEYELRTPGLLNSLLDECYPYSDTYVDNHDGKRPVCRKITSFEDSVDLDEFICTAVLPYGLASLLVQQELPDVANTCLQLYQERLNKARMTRPATESFESVEDVYSCGGYGGGIEYGRFGRWP